MMSATVLAFLSQDQDMVDPVSGPDAQAISVWSESDPEQLEAREALVTYLKNHDVESQVVVHTIYVCGEESRSYGFMRSREILDLISQHPEWQVNERDGDLISFVEYVDDLSESCKQSAYFGLDEMDQLTLFNGAPGYEHAIRTFFQIDIEHLKTSLPQETVDSLYNGIRITDMAQFNSVISTFSQFAINSEDQKAGAEVKVRGSAAGDRIEIR